ncbi:hypothetical protein BpHYR1_024239 [Brachionus plicatilis]|uniref:Uncharacterized protein n=1 Tax=Brachionus plicatilis TaxID=10195 RepID=A0A3M7R8U4_BRAPC|nr:hypothetical protein BpHYR1_024239 [Brachionus plicatilis]
MDKQKLSIGNCVLKVLNPSYEPNSTLNQFGSFAFKTENILIKELRHQSVNGKFPLFKIP